MEIYIIASVSVINSDPCVLGILPESLPQMGRGSFGLFALANITKKCSYCLC